MIITTKRHGYSVGVGDLRRTTTVQALRVVSVEHPTVFHTFSLSLIKVMCLCLQRYVSECSFFKQMGVAL